VDIIDWKNVVVKTKLNALFKERIQEVNDINTSLEVVKALITKNNEGLIIEYQSFTNDFKSYSSAGQQGD